MSDEHDLGVKTLAAKMAADYIIILDFCKANSTEKLTRFKPQFFIFVMQDFQFSITLSMEGGVEWWDRVTEIDPRHPDKVFTLEEFVDWLRASDRLLGSKKTVKKKDPQSDVEAQALLTQRVYQRLVLGDYDNLDDKYD